jgi:hypothetical protein
MTRRGSGSEQISGCRKNNPGLAGFRAGALSLLAIS